MSAQMLSSAGEPSGVAARSGAAVRLRRVVAVLRVAVALLMVTAVFAEFVEIVGYWRRIGLQQMALREGNFFSAFTHEVNLIGAVVLAIGAVLLWRRARADPRWYSVLRLCVLGAIVLTGSVYNLLLRPLPVPPGSQLDWANEVMHVVAPIAIVLDWLLAPGRSRLPFSIAPLVVVYPIVWVVYTFIRGALVPDELNGTPYYYPYPFLDPHGSGGWGAVAVMIGILLVVTTLLGVLAVLAWRLEDRIAARSRRRLAP